ncbi:MAG: cytochrome c oxidase subunit II [Candidatus Limnocylindrales bacterium]
MSSTWLRIVGFAVAGLVVVGLLALMALAGAFHLFPPAPVTDRAREIDGLYNFVFAISVAIFVLVEGLIIFAVIRYRRKPTDTELPAQIHGNNALEVVWTVVPTILVAVMFVFSFNSLTKVDAVANTTDVRIRAVAAQFQWSFEYLSADGQTVQFEQLAPELTVPAGKTVHLSLRSTDVIHAFYVPKFLFKRDVVPGRENAFEFTVDPADAGQTFSGQCAELCGTFHGSMLFTVKALAPADYDSWLATQIEKARQSPPPPGSATPGQLELQLTAKDVKFDKASLDAPADQPFTIKFQNDDASIAHNVAIHDGAGQEVFKGEIFAGVDVRTYPVPPLKAGSYTFVCSVHPNMTGTLTVK